MTGESPRQEDVIHQAVANVLRLGAPDGLVWFHVPNGGKMGPRRGAYLKRMGVRAGVSDFMLIYRGRCLCLEIKAAKGRQSSEQRAFEAEAGKAGADYLIARSSAEAVTKIKDWGCPINAAVAA